MLIVPSSHVEISIDTTNAAKYHLINIVKLTKDFGED